MQNESIIKTNLSFFGEDKPIVKVDKEFFMKNWEKLILHPPLHLGEENNEEQKKLFQFNFSLTDKEIDAINIFAAISKGNLDYLRANMEDIDFFAQDFNHISVIKWMHQTKFSIKHFEVFQEIIYSFLKKNELLLVYACSFDLINEKDTRFTEGTQTVRMAASAAFKHGAPRAMKFYHEQLKKLTNEDILIGLALNEISVELLEHLLSEKSPIKLDLNKPFSFKGNHDPILMRMVSDEKLDPRIITLLSQKGYLCNFPFAFANAK